MRLKTLTINTRGFGSPLSGVPLFDFIQKAGCDICFVQETLVGSDTKIDLFSRKWPWRSFWSPAMGKQGGTAILFLNFVISKCFLGRGTRMAV